MGSFIMKCRNDLNVDVLLLFKTEINSSSGLQMLHIFDIEFFTLYFKYIYISDSYIIYFSTKIFNIGDQGTTSPHLHLILNSFLQNLLIELPYVLRRPIRCLFYKMFIYCFVIPFINILYPSYNDVIDITYSLYWKNFNNLVSGEKIIF